MRENSAVVLVIERNPTPPLCGEVVLEQADLDRRLADAEKQLRAAVTHVVHSCERREWSIRVESHGGAWLDVEFEVKHSEEHAGDHYAVRIRLQ